MKKPLFVLLCLPLLCQAQTSEEDFKKKILQLEQRIESLEYRTEATVRTHNTGVALSIAGGVVTVIGAYIASTQSEESGVPVVLVGTGLSVAGGIFRWVSINKLRGARPRSPEPKSRDRDDLYN